MKKFVQRILVYWLVRIVRWIELLVIRGLSEVAFVVCVVYGDPRVLVSWCWSGSLEKKEKWGILLMCLYPVSWTYKGLGLLIARDTY